MIEVLCNELIGRKVLISFDVEGYEINMSGKVIDFKIDDNHVSLWLDSQIEMNFEVEDISSSDEFDFVVNNKVYIAAM